MIVCREKVADALKEAGAIKDIQNQTKVTHL